MPGPDAASMSRVLMKSALDCVAVVSPIEPGPRTITSGSLALMNATKALKSRP
jgi:hypothetical protein